MYTRIVNYKNALTCKVMILKNAIANINKKPKKLGLKSRANLKLYVQQFFGGLIITISK